MNYEKLIKNLLNRIEEKEIQEKEYKKLYEKNVSSIEDMNTRIRKVFELAKLCDKAGLQLPSVEDLQEYSEEDIQFELKVEHEYAEYEFSSTTFTSISLVKGETVFLDENGMMTEDDEESFEVKYRKTKAVINHFGSFEYAFYKWVQNCIEPTEKHYLGICKEKAIEVAAPSLNAAKKIAGKIFKDKNFELIDKDQLNHLKIYR